MFENIASSDYPIDKGNTTDFYKQDLWLLKGTELSSLERGQVSNRGKPYKDPWADNF